MKLDILNLCSTLVTELTKETRDNQFYWISKSRENLLAKYNITADKSQLSAAVFQQLLNASAKANAQIIQQLSTGDASHETLRAIIQVACDLLEINIEIFTWSNLNISGKATNIVVRQTPVVLELGQDGQFSAAPHHTVLACGPAKPANKKTKHKRPLTDGDSETEVAPKAAPSKCNKKAKKTRTLSDSDSEPEAHCSNAVTTKKPPTKQTGIPQSDTDGDTDDDDCSDLEMSYDIEEQLSSPNLAAFASEKSSAINAKIKQIETCLDNLLAWLRAMENISSHISKNTCEGKCVAHCPDVLCKVVAKKRGRPITGKKSPVKKNNP